MVDVTEKAFETAIENALLQGGPDAPEGELREPRPAYGDAFVAGGYRRRASGDYDPDLCLIRQDVLDFIQATQLDEWQRLAEHHGPEVESRFLKRLAREIERRGTLSVLRKGVKDSGCFFELAYFRPASTLNEDLERLYRANLFSIVRQLHFSHRRGDRKERAKALDLTIFLNGLPLFTAELKGPFAPETVEDARREYSDPKKRDPKEPLFHYGRCLAHFAVDTDLVYFTTRLNGAKTRFFPFNQGNRGSAGNPPVSPTRSDFPTSYLWNEIWAKDSVLDLVRHFIHEVEEEDERGRRTGQRFLLFPRYHQLETVRALIGEARDHGAGQRYLIQHSAGSGKSFSIAWLAHRLSTLHNARDERVFDSIIVVTDRRVLDRQLQRALRQLEHTPGVLENIDKTSRQLGEALADGKTIIVTTLQKFSHISEDVSARPGQRFAVIIDEAHSSQSGESSKSLKAVLAARDLEEAESLESDLPTIEDELEEQIAAEMEKRGHQPHLSLFAFTATPKPKTLELFGTQGPRGFEAFRTYSMRQAIEEGFILDVLANYTTYTAYWRLLKTIEDDPQYDRAKASALLKSFVELHPHAIGQKVEVILAHFARHARALGGKAKAMIVTRSRQHAVRYKLALDEALRARKRPWKALVAFSGEVEDEGRKYTEAGMNGFPDTQTQDVFKRAEQRFLVVANKFQTGFDQPLLYVMYVDKKLGGVNAVQTLSRLNRTYRDKNVEKGEPLVLDFANQAEEIQKAFEPYYETTLLSEGTDPNLLHDLEDRLLDFGVYSESEVDAFARLYFAKLEAGETKGDRLERLVDALKPQEARFKELDETEQAEFRGYLSDFVRLYGFLSQVITFPAAGLEKLYAFARLLRRRLARQGGGDLPLEVRAAIDMESYRLFETLSGKIELEQGAPPLEPQKAKDPRRPEVERLEPLSRIIDELNRRFGTELGGEHRVTLGQMMERLDEDGALEASARVNTRENVRLTFDRKVEDAIQSIVDVNFDFYKLITDDRVFGTALKEYLFDEWLRRQAGEPGRD